MLSYFASGFGTTLLKSIFFLVLAIFFLVAVTKYLSRSKGEKLFWQCGRHDGGRDSKLWQWKFTYEWTRKKREAGNLAWSINFKVLPQV